MSDELGSLETGVLLDELLLAEAWKGDCQLQGIAHALAAQDETATVFGVTHVGAGDEIGSRRRSFEFRVSSFEFGTLVLGLWTLERRFTASLLLFRFFAG